MSYTEKSQSPGKIKSTEASVRVVVGIALILAVIETSITNGLNLSYPILIGSYVVLTGLASWDPMHAFLNSVFFKNKTEKEFSNNVVSA